MDIQSNSFFDMVMRDYEEQLNWPMTIDELSIGDDHGDLRQVGYEDDEGNLRDGNGNLSFVRRLFDDDYLSFDEVRAYESEYDFFMSEQDPDNISVSYEQFLRMRRLPLSIQVPDEPENMLDRITLYTIDPVNGKEKKTIGVFECPICYEDACLTQMVVPSCKHEYCKSCMLQHLESFQSRQLSPNCALCREPYSYLEIFEQNVFEEVKCCVRREV